MSHGAVLRPRTEHAPKSWGEGVPPRAGPDPPAPREEALCSRSHSSPVFPMSSKTSLRTAASRARWGGDSCPPLWVGLGRVFSDPASRRPALLSGAVCGPSVDLSLLPDVRCMIHRAPERGAVTGGQARAGAGDEERAREPGGAASARVGGAAPKRADVSFRPVCLPVSVALSPNSINGRPVTNRPRLTFPKGRQASGRAARCWGFAFGAKASVSRGGCAPRA